MSIDAQWSVEETRGFAWWGHRLRQRVWASEPWDEPESAQKYCRLFAETDLLRGELAVQAVQALGPFLALAELSAMVWDPDTTTLRLRCSVLLDPENTDALARLFSFAASLQIATAEKWADLLARPLRMEVAASAHPQSGARATPDELLSLRETFVAPQGAEPSRWVGDLDTALGFLKAMDLNAARESDPKRAAALGDLWAQVPTGSGAGDALLRIFASQKHPELGVGALVSVLLPSEVVRERPELHPLVLNAIEGDELDHPHALGSFCHLGEEPVTALVAFFPNAIYAPGMLRELCFQFALRGRWAAAVFSAPVGEE